MKKFIEFITELKKPKDLGKAKEILADYPDVDTRRNVFWQGEIGNLFAKEGFKKLGSGKYSTVFSHPKFNYIVKVFMKDAAFLKWYKFCMTNPDNKYVPKFRGKIVKITDNFFALRMERLSSNSLDFDMDFLSGLAQVDNDAKQVYDFLMKHKNLLDMHGENVMMRGKQAVIIDPFYNWFDPSSKKYTIDPNDFDLKKLTP